MNVRKAQALIDELGQLAASYRAGTTASNPGQLDALAAQYLESLAALGSTGWAGALGGVIVSFPQIDTVAAGRAVAARCGARAGRDSGRA